MTSRHCPLNVEMMQRYQAIIPSLIRTVQQLANAGWTPATSGNFSHRLDHQHALITVSGCDKSRLTEADLIVIDLAGQAVASPLRPSAETRLHTQIYSRCGDVGCILHTHSLVQTLTSRLFARQGWIRLSNYELLKALPGQSTHQGHIDVPILPNQQDMQNLAADVGVHLAKQPLWSYLIDGHGFYTWGRTLDEARRHLEMFEFLFHCELALRQYPAMMTEPTH